MFRRIFYCGPVEIAAGMLAIFLVAGASRVQAELAVSDAWVRAMPPGQRMTAAYLRLSNTGAEAILLTGVSVERGDASLHETRTVDGRSTMRAVDELNLPAAGTLDFKPGGMHIMIMGLPATPREGESLKLCLQTTAGETCFPAPVRRAAPRSTPEHSH